MTEQCGIPSYIPEGQEIGENEHPLLDSPHDGELKQMESEWIDVSYYYNIKYSFF
jgi:hypothetical protein